MKNRMEDCLRQEIYALLPIYHEEKGNCVRILTGDGGERIEDRTLRTILRDIGAYYHMDAALIRKKYGELIGCRNGIPMPFTPELILIPFKMRTPVGSNDGAFGYISYLQIEEAHMREGQTEIVLKDGRVIPILESLACFRSRLKNAEMVRKQFLSCFMPERNEELRWMEVGEAYQVPATRADILYLVNSLIHLLNRKIPD